MEQAINENRSTQKPARLPWPELAQSARSSCHVCEDASLLLVALDFSNASVRAAYFLSREIASA